MPDSGQRSLPTSGEIQQALIVDPDEVLPWGAFSLHDEVRPEQARGYRNRLHVFDMPGARSACADDIVVDAAGLSFRKPGFYFFSLPCACLKILVRTPGLDDLQRCIEIADFVSSCTVHSLADCHRVFIDGQYDLRSALAKQFLSDQPHAFHGAEVTVFLIYLLVRQGFAAQRMRFRQKESNNGHVVCHVPIGDGGVILDADYGVAIRLTPEQLLAGRADDFATVPFVPLGAKKFLGGLHLLNNASRSGWTWNASCASDIATFSPDSYRAMLRELCETVELRDTVCDAAGGMRFVQLPAPGEAAEIPPGPDPRRSFAESVGLVLADCAEPKRSHLASLIAQVDPDRVEQIRAKYASDIAVGFPRAPASEIKYLDIPYWLSHKLDLAMSLGLHASSPRNILDLGTGGAHFLAVCQAYGHRGLGIDVANPLYADIAHCLGVRRLVERVEPQKPLLPREDKFDLVTAIWINFNTLTPVDGKRVYWTVDDWLFLCRDLIENHMRLPGTIHFELNHEVSNDVPPLARFNGELLARFRTLGATVDEEQGTIELYCPA